MKLPFFRTAGRTMLGAALAISSTSVSASAATIWWEGTGGTATPSSWADGANWSTTAAGDGAAGAVPATGDDLVFNTTGNTGTRSVAMIENRTALSLTFANTGQTAIISGLTGTNATTLSLGAGGITLASGAGNVFIGNGAANGVATRLLASQTWTNNSTTGTLTIQNSLASNVTGNSSLTFGGVGNFSITNTIQSGSGTLALVKNGSGTLTLTGSNSYGGGTTINGGVISIASNGALGNATGAIIFGGGTLRVTNNVTSTRSVTMNTGGGTFEVGTNLLLTQSSGISGTGGLTKTGTGTLLLSSNISNYAGATLVSAGKLLINGNQSLATGTVTVAAGAIFGGTGTVGGATTISGIHAVGGTAAGADSIGTQTFSSSLAYSSGSSFNWQLGSQATTGPGTNFDKVIVSGQLDISTGTNFNIYVTGLDLNSAFWNTTQTWDVFDANSTTGNFSNFTLYDAAAPTTPVIYGGRGSFSYIPSTGSLQWSVPEPSNALAGLLIAAGLLRRRRTAAI